MLQREQRLTVEVVTLREVKGQGVAEQTAVSDNFIVLDRDRTLQLS